MSTARPTAAELVAAVAGFLETAAIPALAGATAFHARVALNSLRIVERELREGPAVDAAELASLRALLGRDGTLAELNAALVAAIDDGTLATGDGALRAHLLASARARLAIDNPQYPSLTAVTAP